MWFKQNSNIPKGATHIASPSWRGITYFKHTIHGWMGYQYNPNIKAMGWMGYYHNSNTPKNLKDLRDLF